MCTPLCLWLCQVTESLTNSQCQVHVYPLKGTSEFRKRGAEGTLREHRAAGTLRCGNIRLKEY